MNLLILNFEFLQASTYQMAVLLQFNTVKRLTMQQLEESTQLKSVCIFCHLIDICTSSVIGVHKLHKSVWHDMYYLVGDFAASVTDFTEGQAPGLWWRWEWPSSFFLTGVVLWLQKVRWTFSSGKWKYNFASFV